MVYIGRGSPIAKLASDVPGALEVLEAFGLDDACSGGLSLEERAGDTPRRDRCTRQT